MPLTPKSAHIDSALSNISIGYRNGLFIADQVLPHIPCNKASDYFFKFQKGDWFRLDARKRGAGAEAAQGGYKLTTGSYSCEETALAHPVPIELINNADDPLVPLKTGVDYVTKQVMLAKEKEVSDLVMATASWTTSNDAEGGWLATAATNTFIADVFTGKKVVRELIGVDPNVLVMDANTWDNVLQNEDVLDRIVGGSMGTNPAIVTKKLVAQLFGLDEILVGGALYSSDEETLAGTEFTAVRMWEVNAGKGSAILMYRTPAPAINEPNAGYIFEWKGDEGMPSSIVEGDTYRKVRKWWDEPKKSWMVEASESWDQVVTCADAGYIFTDTLST